MPCLDSMHAASRGFNLLVFLEFRLTDIVVQDKAFVLCVHHVAFQSVQRP